jgi:hypothetical protein
MSIEQKIMIIEKSEASPGMKSDALAQWAADPSGPIQLKHTPSKASMWRIMKSKADLRKKYSENPTACKKKKRRDNPAVGFCHVLCIGSLSNLHIILAT